MDSFFSWLRKKLYIESIHETVYALHAQSNEMASDLYELKVALSDVRKSLDLPPIVNMEEAEQTRLPSGDPTGL